MISTSVVPIDRVEFEVRPWQWSFAVEQRAKIDSHFQKQLQSNPSLWNGRLLLLHEYSIDEKTFAGNLFETDYASLLAGLEYGAVGESVKACFGVAALMAADESFVAGLMAPHTRNAGQIMFPSGSIDPHDVRHGRVELACSVQRELMEETGLGPADVEFDQDWYAVFAGPRVPIFKIVRAREPARILCERIHSNLAGEARPEFADFQVVDELDPCMPEWMQVFLRFLWRRERFKVGL